MPSDEIYRKKSDGTLERIYTPQTVIKRLPDGDIEEEVIDISSDVFMITRTKGNRLTFFLEDGRTFYSMMNLEDYEILGPMFLTDTCNVTNLSKIRFVDDKHLFLYSEANPHNKSIKASISRMGYERLKENSYLARLVADNTGNQIEVKITQHQPLGPLKRLSRKILKI